jgi:selenide,water dikinase
MVLCDAQTSGGLLIAVSPENANRLMKVLQQKGVENARIIGEIIPEMAGIIRVTQNKS